MKEAPFMVKIYKSKTKESFLSIINRDCSLVLHTNKTLPFAFLIHSKLAADIGGLDKSVDRIDAFASPFHTQAHRL